MTRVSKLEKQLSGMAMRNKAQQDPTPIARGRVTIIFDWIPKFGDLQIYCIFVKKANIIKMLYISSYFLNLENSSCAAFEIYYHLEKGAMYNDMIPWL